MATYFKPPPQTARTYVNTGQSQAEDPSLHSRQLSTTPDETSIYIFPVPSSIPPSPGGSSTFSIPSDFTGDFTASSGRSRNSSVSSRLTETTRSRTSSLNGLSYVGEDTEVDFSPIGDVDIEPGVEVWDWTEETSDDPSIEDGPWAFEAGGRRTDSGPWHLVRRSSLSGRQLNSLPNSVHQPQPSHRSRTQSSSSSHSPVRSSIYTPQPRVRIPLLSFIASLLSVDLDDSALRLLTYSSSDSVLFPGQGNLLHSHQFTSSPSSAELAQDNSFHSDGTTEASQPHGLLRLLTLESSSKTVRDGLAVVYDAPLVLSSPFSVPRLDSFSGLYRFVGNVCAKSGQAWRELCRSPESDYM